MLPLIFAETGALPSFCRSGAPDCVWVLFFLKCVCPPPIENPGSVLLCMYACFTFTCYMQWKALFSCLKIWTFKERKITKCWRQLTCVFHIHSILILNLFTKTCEIRTTLVYKNMIFFFHNDGYSYDMKGFFFCLQKGQVNIFYVAKCRQ